MLGLASVVCVLLGACAGSANQLIPPSEGGPPWITVKSEHIVLHTDHKPSKARQVIAEFEHRYALLASLLFENGQAPSLRTRAVVFRKRHELYNFTSKAVGGFYNPKVDNQGLPLIVMAGTLDHAMSSTWLHELSHRFLHHAIGPMPVWINEGLAQYYSTITIVDDQAVLGTPLPTLGASTSKGWQYEKINGRYKAYIPISELEAPSILMKLDRTQFYVRASLDDFTADHDTATRRAQSSHYGSAWFYAHMLMNGPEDYTVRFGETLRLVSEGHNFDAAFDQTFGDLDPATLDAAFFDHVTRSQTILWKENYQTPALPAPNIGPMPDAQVLLLWARLGGLQRPHKRTPRQLVDHAMALAPDDPDILLYRAASACDESRWEPCEQYLRASAAANPDHPETQAGLLRIYSGDQGPWSNDERAQWAAEVARDLQRTATTSTQLNTLAWYLALHGQAGIAEPFSRQSLVQAPDCWVCYDTYARIKFELGEFDQAAHFQNIAVQATTEHTSPQNIIEAQDQLREYRRVASQNKRDGGHHGSSPQESPGGDEP